MADLGDLATVIQQYQQYSPLYSGDVFVEPLGNAGGLSGSRLWRIATRDRTVYCLRRWPDEHPTVPRLQFVHAVLLHIAPRLPIVACPLRTRDGSTFVNHSGHLWELTHWLLGAPDDQTPPPPQRLRGAMHALARFHLLAAEFQSDMGRALAVRDRQRLFESSRGVLKAIEQAMLTPLDDELDARSRKLLPLAAHHLERNDLLQALASVPPLELIPAIRDIHREHVLFSRDEVTGLIDFGALRMDTPLADIARLLGSMAGIDESVRQQSLTAYAEVRPLSRDNRSIVDLLDHSGHVGAALNWLRWLYLERRNMGSAAAVAQRLDAILARLYIP